MASNNLKLLIHTEKIPEKPEAPMHVQRIRLRMRRPFQERLLRNSFIACTVLLGILTLNNVRAPWAEKVSDHVEQALTMSIDLDQSFGKLSFVRKIMPESTLVFFDLAKETELLAPMTGTPLHAFDPSEPYLLFQAEAGTAVRAAADGTVSAVSKLSDGTYGILIDHGSGMESVTAGIANSPLRGGDTVTRGTQIGQSADSVYFELRMQDKPIDPTERMGL